MVGGAHFLLVYVASSIPAPIPCLRVMLSCWLLIYAVNRTVSWEPMVFPFTDVRSFDPRYTLR